MSSTKRKKDGVNPAPTPAEVAASEGGHREAQAAPPVEAQNAEDHRRSPAFINLMRTLGLSPVPKPEPAPSPVEAPQTTEQPWNATLYRVPAGQLREFFKSLGVEIPGSAPVEPQREVDPGPKMIAVPDDMLARHMGLMQEAHDHLAELMSDNEGLRDQNRSLIAMLDKASADAQIAQEALLKERAELDQASARNVALLGRVRDFEVTMPHILRLYDEAIDILKARNEALENALADEETRPKGFYDDSLVRFMDTLGVDDRVNQGRAHGVGCIWCP